MKNYRFIIIVLATAAAFQLTSCEQNGLKSKLMGKWRISDMHIQYYEQREKYGQDQIKMLQDSLGRTSDTATTKRIGAQITQIQDQINAFKATQDSAIAKSSSKTPQATAPLLPLRRRPGLMSRRWTCPRTRIGVATAIKSMRPSRR